MTNETTCKREIELEIPADNVTKVAEKVARDIARTARIPGFPPIANLRIDDTGSESSQTVIVNNRASYSHIRTFTVTPSQLGKYLIPAISVLL